MRTLAEYPLIEFRFESTVLEEKALVKTFSSGFRTPFLTEETIILEKQGISGSIRYIQLDGFCLIMKDLHMNSGYSMNITGNSPLFKLHFELEGDYFYTPIEDQGSEISIPGGYFNIIYFSKIKGVLKYKTPTRKTLEVLFTQEFFLKAAGTDFNEIFQNLSKALKKEQNFSLWQKSRPIPPDTIKIIKEIMACRYCSHIKKIYLEARITALLLEYMVDSSTQVPPPGEKLMPKNDLAGIQKVEAHIRERFTETITIAELAPIAALNTSKLKQSFKKVYSTTIFKFITCLRMERARELIIYDKHSVSEAAYEVGYKNPQHFTVAFKKYYGYLPSSLS